MVVNCNQVAVQINHAEMCLLFLLSGTCMGVSLSKPRTHFAVKIISAKLHVASGRFQVAAPAGMLSLAELQDEYRLLSMKSFIFKMFRQHILFAHNFRCHIHKEML